MNARLTVLAAALAASPTLWAATSNVDVYGVVNVGVQPTYATYSAASTLGSNSYFGSSFVPQLDITSTPGATAQISGTDFLASARTSLGSNHALASASSLPTDTLSVASFSGWYDQVTINGGTGTGTLQFNVNLTGNVTVGAQIGIVGYGLLASSVHPAELVSNYLPFSVVNMSPWALDSAQATEIARYDIAASPYNDPNQLNGLFAPAPSPAGVVGIPSIPNPDTMLGGDPSMGFPEYVPSLILTPGANQPVNVTLTGTLEFTYGEAFYLINTLGATVFDLNAFQPFCAFEPCPELPVADGSGPTTLDFSNSAHLVSIVLPEGASFSSASGAAYNVSTVPEPGEWLMLLAGLGLIGWRIRRRA